MTKTALHFLGFLSAYEIDNDLAVLTSDYFGVMGKESNIELRIRYRGLRCETEPYHGVGLCSGRDGDGQGLSGLST